jgi:hypothetical protein
MTYSKLLELIKDMSPEQQAMDVIFSHMEGNIVVSMLSEVCHTDDTAEDALPVGQPILS